MINNRNDKKADRERTEIRKKLDKAAKEEGLVETIQEVRKKVNECKKGRSDVRRGNTTKGKVMAGGIMGIIVGKDMRSCTTTKGKDVAGGSVGIIMGKDVCRGTTNKRKDAWTCAGAPPLRARLGPGAAWALLWAMTHAGATPLMART